MRWGYDEAEKMETRTPEGIMLKEKRRERTP